MYQGSPVFRRVTAVTPGATAVDFPLGLFVGVAGDVTFLAKDASAAVTWTVPAGFYIYGHIVQVPSSGTTATQIFGLAP